MIDWLADTVTHFYSEYTHEKAVVGACLDGYLRQRPLQRRFPVAFSPVQPGV